MDQKSTQFDRRLGVQASLAALALGLMLAAGPAAAVLYKWVDANGRISYSDQPPPGNIKSEIVSGAPPVSAPDAVRSMANQDLDQKKRQTQRGDEQKKAEKARVDAAQQQQACADARAQITILNANELVIMRVNEKGEPVYMDESMKLKERARIETMIRERCPA
jgi:hypothetical protein